MPLADAKALVTEQVGDDAGDWDLGGWLPRDLPAGLGAKGLLCAQVPAAYGGLGWSSAANGELTAHTGALCSSLRSVLTSHGMAAWAVQRFGDAEQRETYLSALTSGQVAGVAFSERGAGSDLSAMTTRIEQAGDEVVVSGEKVWVTAACYADLLLVFGRTEGGAGAVLVPAGHPRVSVDRIASPLGCRAAGHADVRLDGVRLPRTHLLGGASLPLDWLVTTVLTYGRLSVGWGCAGILRACLAAAAAHAGSRTQFGRPLAEHQLVAGHLADLYVAAQTAARACEHASRCWDEGDPEQVTAAVLAKHVAAGGAARGATLAVQVLGSAGSADGHVVARAYRDAKLMEIIEGSNEISRLLLAKHALAVNA